MASDLVVIGVGNTLREDDSVGLVLVRRLAAVAGGRLVCVEASGPDLLHAELVSGFARLLVIDAWVSETEPVDDFVLTPIVPAPSTASAGRFTSHVLDWPGVLALARDLYGHAPAAELLGVAASAFDFSEQLSPRCAERAERAWPLLLERCGLQATAPLSSGAVCR
jgi:hydrogenase maturation protease